MFYFSWLTRSQEVHTSHSLGLHKSRHRLSCIYVEIVTLTPETLIMCSVCSNAFHRFIVSSAEYLRLNTILQQFCFLHLCCFSSPALSVWAWLCFSVMNMHSPTLCVINLCAIGRTCTDAPCAAVWTPLLCENTVPLSWWNWVLHFHQIWNKVQADTAGSVSVWLLFLIRPSPSDPVRTWILKEMWRYNKVAIPPELTC